MSQDIKAVAERVLHLSLTSHMDDRPYADAARFAARDLAHEVLRLGEAVDNYELVIGDTCANAIAKDTTEPQYYCVVCDRFVDGEPSGNADSYDVLCPDRHVIVARRNAKGGE